jgi:hypothetical protein
MWRIDAHLWVLQQLPLLHRSLLLVMSDLTLNWLLLLPGKLPISSMHQQHGAGRLLCTVYCVLCKALSSQPVVGLQHKEHIMCMHTHPADVSLGKAAAVFLPAAGA